MDLQELEITAQLAHLNLSKDELKAAFPAFEQMIGFFAAMQEADNDTVIKSYPAAEARLAGAEHFRFEDNDMPAPKERDSVLNRHLLETAGERDGRFIVIPNVL